MSAPNATHHNLEIPVTDVVLQADMAMPEAPRGAVLFAHGSGSGRHSPRNRYVADELSRAGLATVLADLLTPEEERRDVLTGALRFDITMLARRVTGLVDWCADRGHTAGLSIGLFGASTGAAAALVTAARRPNSVAAVVSRGGRPDLADRYLPGVRQPTLLIVGENDPIVINLNRVALGKLGGEAMLDIIPAATHLFPEPGTLEQVARLARSWFLTHLPRHDKNRA